ncbi:MAG: GDSL-type esterase/lipase family protein [Polyangiales bacterium]
MTLRWMLPSALVTLAACAARPVTSGGYEIGRAAPYGHDREPVVFARPDASASHTPSSDGALASLDDAAAALAADEPYAPELRNPVRDEASSGVEGAVGDEAVAGSSVDLEDPARAMDAVYSTIAAVQRRAAPARLTVVQLGDSHTESDEFSGRLRRRIAQQWGAGGRGFVPVAGGASDVRRTLSGPWTIERAPLRNASGAYGMGLARAIGRSSQAAFTVESCARCAVSSVSQFTVYFRRQNGGGSIEYRVDQQPWQRVSTAGASEAASHRVSVTDGAHTFSIRPAGDGPVEVYGVAMDRDAGASLESAGTIGAQASHLDNADWTVLGSQLASRAPSLVLLWFGTNESASSRLDPARFERALSSLVTRVRAAVPTAVVLIVSPPDLALRTRDGTRAQPAQLALMADAARRAARASNAVFYDLLTAMGGQGTVQRWVAQTPPLAWPDHTHYTPAGYNVLADTLFDAVLRGYEAYSRRAATRATGAPTRGPR